MAVKFRATRKEFTLHDESGYSFDVVLVHDEETGWSAHTSFASHGRQHEEAALLALQQSIEKFLSMLTEFEP